MLAGMYRISAASASAAVSWRLPCGASRTVAPQRGHSARSPRAGESTRWVRSQVGQHRTSECAIPPLQQLIGHEARTAMNQARSFAALRQRPFRGLFTGAALAMMADSIEHVISYWILFEKFQSPALGGFAVVSHWLPFLLFSRSEERRVGKECRGRGRR